MSIIRYRFKADKNFESVNIDGMSCSLGELKRLIAAKSSRSGSHYPKDDYDLIISNANTHEEYKDNSDLIPRNASVIVARRIRGTVDTLTPFSNQKPVVSSDDIVKDILMPAILHQNQAVTTAATTRTTTTTTTTTLSMPESNAVVPKKASESTVAGPTKELTEDELIKEIQMDSQARYVTQQPSYRTGLFVCHNCKQPGHIKSQCPLILSSSSNSTAKPPNQSSTTETTANTNTTTSRPNAAHSSHIVTRHTPYSIPYHHRGNRSHRGAGHPRGEPLPKKTTGIPRDRLIPVPKHIPGALRDSSGTAVVPRQMAELFIERIEKKDSLAQIGRQGNDKNVSSAAAASTKSADTELPPKDLLCPLCKRIFTDAVITPCCSLSFCDECIRTALIDSPEHECPHCHCQHVAIDQINPNLFLRDYVKRWYETQNQASYSSLPSSQHSSQGLYQDTDTSSGNLASSQETEEYDPSAPLTNTQQQSSPLIKTAPIVIKMQPLRKSQSPQPIVSTRPADMTFEDEKITDSDQLSSSQKMPRLTEEPAEVLTTSNTPETDKPEREIHPAHMPPMNPIYQPPTMAPTMAPNNPVVPHYYQVPPHPNVVYPPHIPSAPPNGLYPMQPNYYPAPLGVRYPPGGIHHYPSYAPVPPIHHHPPPPPPPIVAASHIPTNGYNMPGFHPHGNAPYTSTSTFIAHHQTATQPLSTALSENEFYIKQRYFKRIQRSPSSSRRSRSSSYSSYSSSDSRSSSRSRYNHRRRSSRSRSRHRVKSPVRDSRRQRRSSSYRDRRRPSNSKEKNTSKYRRSPVRAPREAERRRSPRPPPTIQQSTQRTIVYLQESSHSTRDRRRSKSRSREADGRMNSSSAKKEQQMESKVIPMSPPVKPQPTLSSKVESVVEDAVGKAQEENSKNGKKHKKHKKHRHSSSKSKKRHRSKDKEKKTIVDTTTSVIEIHS